MLTAMELQAITGQLFVRNGEPQAISAVPGILAQPAPTRVARGRERDYLFVHLSLSGSLDDTAEISQQLVDILSSQFYQTTGSTTSALRRAIQATNQQLLTQNLQPKASVREGALTCAVMRSGELYMVQVGESLALLGHNFGIERIPSREPDHTTPLGRSAGLDFRYFHQRLHGGDMLLLADPRMAHLPAHALSSALVDTEVEMGLDELRQLVGDDTARLLLIEFTDDAPPDMPVVARPSGGGSRIRLRKSATTATAAASASAETDLDLPDRPPVREQSPALSGETSAQPESPSLPSIPIDTAELASSAETTARRAAAGGAMGASRVTGWMADMIDRIRGPQEPDEEPRSWMLPAILAVVIPIIVAVVVSSVYLQRGRVQRMAEIRQEMNAALALATEAGDDEAAAREQYSRLLTLAEEADTLRPGDTTVNQLREQAYGALDQLDNVSRLTAEIFATYPPGTEDEPANMMGVTLQEGFNGGVFTLDATDSRVWSHTTDESYLNELDEEEGPTLLLQTGDAVGTHVVGRIVDTGWRPRGLQVSRDGLAMLDSRGALITFFPNFEDTRAVPLGLASQWRDPVALAQFGERIYILDPGSAVIWRYFPDGDGFIVDENERTLDLGPEAALSTAVDFDIYSEDGSVVVAYGDGNLRYFDSRSGRVQWDANRLMETGLTSPLISPTAVKVAGRGLNASIFVLDAGSGRVIQISRGGTVLAQYRAADEDGLDLFSRATNLDVAEAPLRIFISAEDGIYVARQ